MQATSSHAGAVSATATLQTFLSPNRLRWLYSGCNLTRERLQAGSHDQFAPADASRNTSHWAFHTDSNVTTSPALRHSLMSESVRRPVRACVCGVWWLVDGSQPPHTCACVLLCMCCSCVCFCMFLSVRVGGSEGQSWPRCALRLSSIVASTYSLDCNRACNGLR